MDLKVYIQLTVLCAVNVMFFLHRNNFKHIGDRQLLEILGISSKEIVLFHDHGAVVLRFPCGHNESSIRHSSPGLMVK